MTKKALIIMIILLFLFFGTGVFVGIKIKSKSSVPGNQANTYQAGWDAAKKQLEKKGIGVLPGGMEIKNLSGTVDKISGNIITIKNVSSVDPLSDSSLDTRTVQISSNTKFYQLVQKDSAEYQKEMSDFQSKMQEQMKNPSSTAQPITPPMPQNKKEIALSDLKEGQNITVVSDDDIKDKKEFSATEVVVQPDLSQLSPIPVTNAPVPPAMPVSNNTQATTATSVSPINNSNSATTTAIPVSPMATTKSTTTPTTQATTLVAPVVPIK